MQPREIVISAVWDAEAEVFVATSQDVPGLVAEAGSEAALIEKLRTLVPELLELNGVPGLQSSGNTEIPLILRSERRSKVVVPA